MNIIACVNQEWAIGYKNSLLYSIPKDMEYFKSMTLNKTVIMGRKTYQSLRIKPLPNRYNIVISKTFDLQNITICQDISSVYQSIKNIPSNDIFIIGGEKIYKSFIDDCSTAYITKVYNDVSIADKFFPINLDISNEWELLETSEIFCYNNLKYSFNTYKKRSIL